jgi:alpha-amylase
MATNLPDFIPKVCYEIFVRSFCDSNGDGIGDLNGIISKLDYLQELGIEAIWLTPVHPSPSYHKYDVIDFYAIDPEYGTLDDFKNLLLEAHKRNIVVYLDLIVNHTSTLHPWFVEASKGPDNPFRNFYWWMTPEKIEKMGIGSREMSADSNEVYPWHENEGDAEQYYGLFFSGMPDLNYDSEKLRIELSYIIHFWLIEIGVDGFRLDAARHIYPTWVKYNNQHFWWFFDYFVRNIKPGTFTVGEIWAKAEEVAPYFKNLNSAFHFDISFALQRILLSEKDENLVTKLLANYELFAENNPEFMDAIMLTNHDQDRIGSVVGNNPDKIKLAASILLTLPGQPYLYYGEEIGMLGTKPDIYIREPFLWSEDPDDPTSTKWHNAEFSTLKNVTPLSIQQADPDSIFNHYKSLVSLRKEEPALAQIVHPNIQSLELDDDGLLGYLRPHSERPILVIHNLTRLSKYIVLPIEKQHYNKVLFAGRHLKPLGAGEWEMAAYSTVILSQVSS